MNQSLSYRRGHLQDLIYAAHLSSFGKHHLARKFVHSLVVHNLPLMMLSPSITWWCAIVMTLQLMISSFSLCFFFFDGISKLNNKMTSWLLFSLFLFKPPDLAFLLVDTRQRRYSLLFSVNRFKSILPYKQTSHTNREHWLRLDKTKADVQC